MPNKRPVTAQFIKCGCVLKELRDMLGITQAELSKIVGVSHKRFSDIEQGRQDASLGIHLLNAVVTEINKRNKQAKLDIAAVIYKCAVIEFHGVERWNAIQAVVNTATKSE